MKKKCIIKQRDSKDCGVTCLASIISYYDGFVPIEQLRKETMTSQKGTNAYHIINAAKTFGFDAYGTKTNDLKNIPNLPCIAHVTLENGMNHFIVIYEIHKGKLLIMDPSVGKKKITISDFQKIWTNNILLFQPKNKIAKWNKDNTLKNLVINILKNNKKIVISLIAVSIILTVINIILNYYYELAISIISYNNQKYLNNLIVIFLIVTIIKTILTYTREYYENYLSKNIDFPLYKKFISHTLLIPLNVAKSRSSGELITRIKEIDNIKSLIIDVILTVFLDLVLASVAALLLVNISKNLFNILCITIIIYIIISLIFSKVIYIKIMESINKETTFNEFVIDNINNLESIKNTNCIEKQLSKTTNQILIYLKNTFELRKSINFQTTIKNIVMDIGLFTINSYAFILIYQNELELINLMTFNAFLIYLWNPIKNSVDIIPKYNYIKATVEKLNDYLSIEQEQIKNNSKVQIHDDIVMENISYSHNKLNKLLKNFNCHIKKNSIVQIKGKSGSGKSTICKMLFRLISPDSGNILIGGVNIRDYTLTDIRNNIAYSSQNESLFTDTIINNITMGLNFSNQLINEIINLCELKELIDTLPLRFETTIHKDANNFSGGEKQRIILARTLLLKRNVIILDESLSEIPIEQEERIIKNIKKKFSSKTIIIISHKNLSYKFDQIISVNKNE